MFAKSRGLIRPIPMDLLIHTHTHAHARTHRDTHRCVRHIQALWCTSTHTHTHTQVDAHTHTSAYMLSSTHIYMHYITAHSHRHKHTQKHTNINTQTNTYATHTLPTSLARVWQQKCHVVIAELILKCQQQCSLLSDERVQSFSLVEYIML